MPSVLVHRTGHQATLFYSSPCWNMFKQFYKSIYYMASRTVFYMLKSSWQWTWSARQTGLMSIKLLSQCVRPPGWPFLIIIRRASPLCLSNTGMSTRESYHSPRHKLVLALDVGTTYSGVSLVKISSKLCLTVFSTQWSHCNHSVLDPDQVPRIKGVTRSAVYFSTSTSCWSNWCRFPAHEHISGPVAPPKYQPWSTSTTTIEAGKLEQ